MLLSMHGNPDFASESVVAYETGYRIKPHRRFSVDIAVFYNRYSDASGVQVQTPYRSSTPPPLHMVLPGEFVNGVGATSYGLESFFHWQVNRFWKLTWNHAYLKVKTVPDPGVVNMQQTTQSPTHQLQFRSEYSLPHGFQFGMSARYVSSLPGASILQPFVATVTAVGIPINPLALSNSTSSPDFLTQPYVQSHVRCDLRLAWDPRTNMRLEVVGQDLLSPRHPESNETDGLVFSAISQPSRNVFAKLTWRF